MTTLTQKYWDRLQDRMVKAGVNASGSAKWSISLQSSSQGVQSLACVFDAHGDCRLTGCSCRCHRDSQQRTLHATISHPWR